MVQLFEKFAEMVDSLPPKAVIKAAKLERQMLDDDLAHKRTMPMAEVRSIVTFCDFLQNGPEAARGVRFSVPIQHLGFYRSTVKRLVNDGELPYEAGEIFDAAFLPAMRKALGT